MKSRYWLALAAFCIVVSAGGRVGAVESAESSVTLEIRAQPLRSALSEFGRQSGLQVMFIQTDVAEAVMSPPLAGTYSPQAALDRLLANTSLAYEFINPRTVAIRARSGESESEPSPTALTNMKAHQLYVAQTEGDPVTGSSPGTSQESDERLEEIVVTAQKRVERLIDVPQAVSVLSADQLMASGATQFRDFADSIPGLTFRSSGAGASQISMRGITSGSFDISPTVGIYVDEVPYGSSTAYGNGSLYALDVGLFDLDRIEVLRGPQGTLYGANAMGGLIKYVTRTPDASDLSARVITGVSQLQDGGTSYNGAAVVNAPLVSDKVGLRASAFYSHDGGYMDNVARGTEDVDQARIYGSRLDLRLAPSESLSIRLSGFAQDIHRDGRATVDILQPGVPLETRIERLEQFRRASEPFDNRFRLVSGTVQYDLGRMALTSISSYQTIGVENAFDQSRVIPFFDDNDPNTPPLTSIQNAQAVSTDKFAQEIRLASQGETALEWTLGAFYTHESTQRHVDWRGTNVQGTVDPGLVHLFAPSTYDEYAIFANSTWHITDKLEFGGGARYARNDQEFQVEAAGRLVRPSSTNSAAESIATYLANARYHFTERTMGYLRYATSYRPGGPNYLVFGPGGGLIAPETFDSDTLKSYEVGIKGESNNRRFGAELAVFHINWENIQVLSAAPNGADSFANVSGGAISRGAELSLTARPIEGFVAVSTFSYLDSYLREDSPEVSAVKGERLPAVPRVTAALAGDYSFATEGLRPRVGATVRYVSERLSEFNFGFPRFELDDYTAVDLRAGVSLHTVDLQLYGRNIFDTRGQMSGSALGLSIIPPRSIGISASVSF
jgi:outer membrane receptor protein involved in Fe transport